MTYSASLDTLTKIVTGGIFLGAVALYVFMKDTWGFPVWFGFFSLIFILSFILRPVRYELHPGELIIHRLIQPVVIKRADFLAASVLSEKDQRGMLRTFGSGGFFGYFGYFWSKQLGKFTMYATRRDHLVLIEQKDGKKVVISPDDQQFLQALERQWKVS